MLFYRNFHRWLMGGEFREFPKRDLIDWPFGFGCPNEEITRDIETIALIKRDRRALRRVTNKSMDVIFRTRGVRIVH